MGDSKYLVLARKYRPLTFLDLVGQEALVQTISNAIKSRRVPHAYLLTGIRGVGKTTSARIIAKALNCIGADGNGDITVEPCGVCSHCKAIFEDRDIDVIEIDAASNTGVDSIREIIEGAKYVPTSARFKVYIIDEVHMLSKSAFNALLKTLEEPPSHVKFIFATTEIRKIPITILSRCQKFDLKRLDKVSMSKHLQNIALKEEITLEEKAADLIAELSEGSARDGLSLLDQAIAYVGQDVSFEDVKAMVGIVDKQVIFDLFYEIMSGNVKEALAKAYTQYEGGADPSVVLGDLLELTHLISKTKVSPALANDEILSEALILRAKELAKTLNMASLTLAWQMFLKGLDEVNRSPFPFKSLEMVIIRLCYTAGIPDFKELLKKKSKLSDNVVSLPKVMREEPKSLITDNKPSDTITNVFELYQRAESEAEPILAYNIKNRLRPISFESGKIRIESTNDGMGEDMKAILKSKLKGWTGQDWDIETVKSETRKVNTIRENHQQGKETIKEIAMRDPLVQEVLNSFKHIEMTKVEISGVNDDSEDVRDESIYALSLRAEELEEEA